MLSENRGTVALLAGIFLLSGDHDAKKGGKPKVGPNEDLVEIVVPEGAQTGDKVDCVNPETPFRIYAADVPEGNSPGSKFYAAIPRDYSTIALKVPKGEGPGSVCTTARKHYQMNYFVHIP